MKKMILFLLVGFFFYGCEPVEDNRTACQKENVGYFAFQNTSANAYDVFINGTYYKQQPGNSYSSQWVAYPAGKAYTIKVQQVSGYVFSPTVKNYNVTLNQCDEKVISFP